MLKINHTREHPPATYLCFTSVDIGHGYNVIEIYLEKIEANQITFVIGSRKLQKYYDILLDKDQLQTLFQYLRDSDETILPIE